MKLLDSPFIFIITSVSMRQLEIQKSSCKIGTSCHLRVYKCRLIDENKEMDK